jgi:hypothetical protein
MAAKVELFRTIACSLPGAVEGAHMGHPDFRAYDRIFATLAGLARGRGVLKLTLEQQAAYVAELPEVFEPVQGGWGRMGMTYIDLERADEATMRGALMAAYRNVAMKHEAGQAKGSRKSKATRTK